MIRYRTRGEGWLEETQALTERIPMVERPLMTNADLDPLLDAIGDARYVLLGEASHGTSEYYSWRARLSQRLIREKGFSFIGVEGDWPACYEINRYVKSYPHTDQEATHALAAFTRWPTWMWANWEIVALAEWLRRHNAGQVLERQVGFYGLDVYSLQESMTSVIEYLRAHVPEAVATAARAYQCFEPYGEDVEAYAFSTAFVPDSCEDEVVELLMQVRSQPPAYDNDPEAAFNAEQNAWVMVGAERYYRTMLRGNAASWNIRDFHMADTLDRLMEHHGPDAKAIVWEHNTHIGDARATDMAGAGMVNVGQLVRERHEAEGVFLVGFGSHQGTVIAGSAWGAPMRRMKVPPAEEGSWESVLHRAGRRDKLLLMDELRDFQPAQTPRGHRAIGVVYHPQREAGNYVPTVLTERYDAFLYLDETRALHPLHDETGSTRTPDLYPFGV
ncbi:MAG TPA: erythromycin esterase family protein [Caldilineaceae bacterium]|nr:erythromycin esterase family protein [Caldilineaceae bacterium]